MKQIKSDTYPAKPTIDIPIQKNAAYFYVKQIAKQAIFLSSINEYVQISQIEQSVDLHTNVRLDFHGELVIFQFFHFRCCKSILTYYGK